MFIRFDSDIKVTFSRMREECNHLVDECMWSFTQSYLYRIDFRRISSFFIYSNVLTTVKFYACVCQRSNQKCRVQSSDELCVCKNVYFLISIKKECYDFTKPDIDV